jgi:biopolymer transport protein ExbD
LIAGADRARSEPELRKRPMLRPHTRARAEIPTSSMADIAFLLLVFFLVTTVFDEERGLPTQPLPQPEQPIRLAFDTARLHFFDAVTSSVLFPT